MKAESVETTKAEKPAEVYTFAGQRYRAVRVSTMGHDLYVMRLLGRAGLTNLTPKPQELTEDFGVRLLNTVIAYGAPLELLAALILPDGIPDEKWAPELVDHTTKFLEGLTAEEDKAEVERLLITLLLDFFKQGLRYLNASRTASQKPTQPAQPQQPNEGSSASNT